MKLEKILRKVVPLSAMGTLAIVAYGCGGEEGETVVQETVGGLYNGAFEVTEDPQDKVLPEDETGEITVPVIPLNSDESYIQVGLFEWHDFKHNSDGSIDDKWSDIYGVNTFEIKGKIADGNLNLDACVDVIDFWTSAEYRICWKLNAEKQTDYVPENAELGL